MGEQKKPSVRDVLWRKKHARDNVLDAVPQIAPRIQGMLLPHAK